MSEHRYGPPRQAAARPASEPPETNVPFVVLGALLTIGAVVLFTVASDVVPKDTVLFTFAEHLGSALVVAAVIGFTYEWLLHKKREEYLQLLAEDQRQAMRDELDAFVAMSEREIFTLIQDIATRVNGKLPTLFSPPRDADGEYTFAGSMTYFEALVAGRRREVVDTMAVWLDRSSDQRLKYLASDFVGQFRLVELRAKLEEQIRFDDWDALTEAERCCRLNYVWAASRSDPQRPYRRLAELARRTQHRDIVDWILFVPYQMKDPEFLEVVRQVLSRDDLSGDQLTAVIRALGELAPCDPRGVLEVFRRFARTFRAPAVLPKVVEAWSDRNLDVAEVRAALGPGARGGGRVEARPAAKRA